MGLPPTEPAAELLPSQQETITDKIAALKNQLDAPSKRYQTYLQQTRRAG